MRVRQALSYPRCRQALRGKLPKEVLEAPEQLCKTKISYPTTLLKLFNDTDKYCTFGVVTEALLREQGTIKRENLARVVAECTGIETPITMKSKVLDAYLENVQSTRDKMLALANGAPLEYDQVVGGNPVEGHPDARTATDIFEVKTSGRVGACWTEFIMQLFAYAALDERVERVHLVLPLQNAIWSWNVRELWPKRKDYRTALDNFAAAQQAASAEVVQISATNTMELLQLSMRFPIGRHISKHPRIASTLKLIPDPSRPYQIFLGNPSSTKVNTSDEDLAESRALIEHHRLRIFIHAPYLINLASMNEYNIPCMAKLLQSGAAMGARGVIVHVGKSTQQTTEAALANMRANISALLEHATPECPLLLETPAGQGTELLTEGVDTFMEFVTSFSDTRFAACIDTCHVFAAGVRPLEYLSQVLGNDRWAAALHAVHFNDSQAELGARLDRHAPPGYGRIGGSEMIQCAELCTLHNLPMIME